jgi:7-cyano-7-deazaguanine synthase in queuosine biosynthesis
MAATKPEINSVVVDSYTTAALQDYDIIADAQKIVFEGPDQNFDLRLPTLQKFTRKKLHSLAKDMYRIAASVYFSDLRIARPDKIRSRSIGILISVSDKSKWDAEKEHLESMIRFMSGDHVRFYFVQGEMPTAPPKFIANENRSICLFSGGLDSLAGVKWLKERGIRPVLVSHCAHNRTCHAQKTLATLLKAVFASKIDTFQISARFKGGKQMTTVEFSQASRSFLFLALATNFALNLGIQKIRIFENGVLGLNIPIVPSRIFNNTRTVHPTFLTKFNNLISSIFPNTFSVENPFIMLTKGEVVKMLDDKDFKNMIKESVSCSKMDRLRWAGIAGIKHCGTCLPCVLRRFSIHHAGLDGDDDRYADDIFGAYEKIPLEAKTLLFQILEFGRRLDRNDEDVINDIPQFYVPEIEDTGLSITMMRKCIAEAKAALRNKASQSVKDQLSSKL